jgi:fatty acid desaturase
VPRIQHVNQNPAKGEGKILASLRKVKFHRFLIGLLADWLVIVAVLILAKEINHVAAWLAAVFIIGTRQHAIGVLGHDGAHKLASGKIWLNDSVTQLFCFWPVSADMYAYKPFHFPHHKFVNTPKDPEMEYRRLGDPEWDIPRSQLGITIRFVKDLVGLGAFETIRVLYSIRPKRFTGYLGPLLTFTAASVVTGLTGTLWILAVWVAALFTSFPAVWRVRCWIEHLGTDSTHRVTMASWLSWFIAPHNVYMHWEHHKWPAIPYWNLPRARTLDVSVPITTIWELFRYYGRCRPMKSGTPTLDELGNPVQDFV